MLYSPYTIEWNEKENTWNVITEQIRRDYIIKGLPDPDFAEQVANALNEAYHQGVIDEKERHQEKIKGIFGIQ